MAANSFGYNGFTPLKHQTGGIIRANAYYIKTSGTTGFDDNIFSGDVVAMNADGTIETMTAGAGSATAPVLIGIFAGCQYTPSSDNTPKWAPNWVASTAVVTGSSIIAWVYDDPYIVFGVTSDDATVSAQLDVGLNADHVVGTGNTTTGQSGSYLNMASGTGTATATFRIVGITDMPGNVIGNTKTRYEVIGNEHLFRLGVGV